MTAVTKQAPVEIAVHQSDATAPPAIIELLRLAIDKGVPVEALERLQAMHERASDRAAAQEFTRALAVFQQNCPAIPKNKTVEITKDGRKQYSYNFAELDKIMALIGPGLAEAGFAVSWDTQFTDKTVRAVCTARHIGGHRESSSFESPVSGNPQMTEQQRYAAAGSYARRYALLYVLGLTTGDPDTDGGARAVTITQEQADDLKALCEEVGVVPSRVLKWAGVGRFEDVPAVDYDTVCARVSAARKGAK